MYQARSACSAVFGYLRPEHWRSENSLGSDDVVAWRFVTVSLTVLTALRSDGQQSIPIPIMSVWPDIQEQP
jgi:hypothetical protein